MSFLFRLGCLQIFLLAAAGLHAATLPQGFTETAISGLSSATAMAIAPDGRVFVCQQGGALRVVKNGQLLTAPFITLNVNSSGERGLLGIAFDPNFTTNNYVYLYYTTSTAPVHNRVSRFTANGDAVVANSEVILLELDNLTSATNHNGGAMHFGADGKLYIATGENATSSNSQTLANKLGKILRLNSDGSIPTDNPFYNQASGTNRTIWALGLRNPFTFSFQQNTSRMFINDVGQNAIEEINDGMAGANYGWPNCEGICGTAGFTNPVYQYLNDASTCAITGGAFYNPTVTQFPADYRGKYFFADFCAGWIMRLDPATATVTGFATGIASPVDIQVANDGALYYLARSSNALYRVTYPAGQTADTFQFGAAAVSGSEGNNAVSVTVSRTGNAGGAATVDYATGGGTALSTRDYEIALGTLRFAAGETQKTITVLLNDDGYAEGSETFDLSLSNVTGSAVLGATSIATITINDNDAAPASVNRIEDPPFFVRMQYHDFLNRQPDPDGLSYWTNQITQCGADTNCIRRRRSEVSAQFFIETEFQDSGYFVYRAYRAAFDRRPQFLEFARDRSGVIGGSGLEQGKTDFINAFTTRAAFTQIYPATQTSAQYVDALNANTGNSLTTTERNALVAALNNNSQTRAQVFRSVIDNAAFRARENNPAFVLMQYFGYLRRNPDTDGYNFWLNVLNTQNNFRFMVCNFITSREYQDRFGSDTPRSNAECNGL